MTRSRTTRLTGFAFAGLLALGGLSACGGDADDDDRTDDGG